MIILWVNCESIELECDYNNYATLGYCCVVKNSELITSKNDRQITEIKAQNLLHSSDDVTCFYASGVKINFFPRGLTKFFKNISNIQIWSANLQEISKDDLKEFGENLKKFDVLNNEIKVIKSDLFEYNRNLVGIGFHRNKINKIEAGAFSGLDKIHTLELSSNPCTSDSDSADFEPLKVPEIIKNVEEKCSGN